MLRNSFLLFMLLLSSLSFGQVKSEYALIDQKISKIPYNLTNSTSSIANYINSNFRTDSEKIRAIFYWTASNINYDLDNVFNAYSNESTENLIKKTLESRKGVCINYAEIFNDIAHKVGIESVIIEGYTKQNGILDKVAHAWCGAKIDNKWYVFDPTWGSGYANKGRFFKKINNYYFKAEPNKMISSHMPFDYLWQFLHYPVTNQDFYDGKIQINTSKKQFDFEREISRYENLSEIDQLIASAKRIDKNGVKNALVFERLSSKKREIEYYKQKIIVEEFNSIVNLYNEGINEFNEFIKYKNKQFKPIISDEDIRIMIDSPLDKLLNCQELLNNLGEVDKNNLQNVNAIRRALVETIKQVDEQELFVTRYLSKSNMVRKAMFTKVTWF
jgi:tetratricopeptide (TPR) repeat protein